MRDVCAMHLDALPARRDCLPSRLLQLGVELFDVAARPAEVFVDLVRECAGLSGDVARTVMRILDGQAELIFANVRSRRVVGPGIRSQLEDVGFAGERDVDRYAEARVPGRLAVVEDGPVAVAPDVDLKFLRLVLPHLITAGVY